MATARRASNAGSVVSTSTSVFGGSTDERHDELRQMRKAISESLRTFTAEHAPLSVYDAPAIMDHDGRHEAALDVDQRRRGLLIAVNALVDKAHDLLDPNNVGDFNVLQGLVDYVHGFIGKRLDARQPLLPLPPSEAARFRPLPSREAILARKRLRADETDDSYMPPPKVVPTDDLSDFTNDEGGMEIVVNPTQHLQPNSGEMPPPPPPFRGTGRRSTSRGRFSTSTPEHMREIEAERQRVDQQRRELEERQQEIRDVQKVQEEQKQRLKLAEEKRKKEVAEKERAAKEAATKAIEAQARRDEQTLKNLQHRAGINEAQLQQADEILRQLNNVQIGLDDAENAAIDAAAAAAQSDDRSLLDLGGEPFQPRKNRKSRKSNSNSPPKDPKTSAPLPVNPPAYHPANPPMNPPTNLPVNPPTNFPAHDASLNDFHMVSFSQFPNFLPNTSQPPPSLGQSFLNLPQRQSQQTSAGAIPKQQSLPHVPQKPADQHPATGASAGDCNQQSTTSVCCGQQQPMNYLQQQQVAYDNYMTQTQKESSARMTAFSTQRAKDARPPKKFSTGTTIEFKNTMYRFDLATNLPGMDSRTKLNELVHWFDGNPGEIISCFAINPDADMGFSLALSYLDSLFGSTSDSLIPLIRQLTAGNRIGEMDYDGHITLFTKMIQAETMAASIGQFSQLDRREVIAEIVENRLQHFIKDFWKQDRDLRRFQSRSMAFSDLKLMIQDWISTLSSRRATLPPKTVKAAIIGAKPQQPTSGEVEDPIKDLNVNAHQVAPNRKPAFSGAVKDGRRKPQSTDKCLVCDSVHKTEACNVFAQMPVDKRVDKAYELRICFICLEKGHIAPDCTITPKCANCKGRHHTLFHGRQPPKKRANVNLVETIVSPIQSRTASQTPTAASTATTTPEDLISLDGSAPLVPVTPQM